MRELPTAHYQIHTVPILQVMMIQQDPDLVLGHSAAKAQKVHHNDRRWPIVAEHESDYP